MYNEENENIISTSFIVLGKENFDDIDKRKTYDFFFNEFMTGLKRIVESNVYNIMKANGYMFI